MHTVLLDHIHLFKHYIQSEFSYMFNLQLVYSIALKLEHP